MDCRVNVAVTRTGQRSRDQRDRVPARRRTADDRRGVYGAVRSHHLSATPIWVHDGTAAARAVACRTPTVVIMLGAAIGVGFAPDASTVGPAATELTIG